MRRVVLLTDFGTADGYAAAIAAVVADGAPDALVEHASHEIAPGDVFGAALALRRYALRYPAGTVHLVVVDPGVGTARRALAAEVDGRLFVAPDNGVLTLVLREGGSVRAVRLPDEDAPSATFHGRDVFGPAAARLAAGTMLDELGEPLDRPVLLAVPEATRRDEGIEGEVLHADRYGNLITNIPSSWVDPGQPLDIQVISRRWQTQRMSSYAQGEGKDHIFVLPSSCGYLELTLYKQSAAEKLGAKAGDMVSLHC